MLEMTPAGLYCRPGGFHIDPWRRVDRAVITHGHGDHARPGMGSYLCSRSSAPILTARLGHRIRIQALDWGEVLEVNGVRLSLHPAGHITGSAQVRMEQRGRVWAVTGDYKTEADGTAEPFELVPCHGLVTETTFGLPIYRWRPQEEVFAEINRWRIECMEAGVTPVLTGYSLGKAQRLLAGIDQEPGPVIVHGAVAEMNLACQAAGARLPRWRAPSEKPTGLPWSRCLVIAPPGRQSSAWGGGRTATGFASGWMAVRGKRKMRGLDRGFVLSDHVDWPSLNQTVEACGAETVWTTHGYAAQTARWLREKGLDARPLDAAFGGEDDPLLPAD